MQVWDPQFAAHSSMFDPVRAMADALQGPSWPAPEQLNALATAQAVVSGGGHALQFVDASDQPAPGAADYELRIHDEGVVPLRPANWHDFFNALVWLTFPRVKAALNAAHTAELRAASGTTRARNRRRDALTLFDESGVLVLSREHAVLDDLRAHRWQRVFWKQRETLMHTTRFCLFGHGLYEKALLPYVGMTGHALLLQAPPDFDAANEAVRLAQADALAADVLMKQVMQPRDLSPLPVLGVPGWWAANRHADFYANTDYFRPPRKSC
jgi:hypothetical protein